MGTQPGKQVCVLPGWQVPGQDLIEMVVTVDQPWQQDMPAQVEDDVGVVWKLVGWPHLFDESIPRKEPGIAKLSSLIVHRDEHIGMFDEQRSHTCILSLQLANSSDLHRSLLKTW